MLKKEEKTKIEHKEEVEEIKGAETPKFEVEVEKVGEPEEEIESKQQEPSDTRSETKASDLTVEVERESKPGSKKPFLFVLIIVLILALVGGGIFIYKKTVDKGGANLKNGPAPTPMVEQPTPTPEPLAKDALKIEILNGSGVPGAAGVAQKYLEGLGYKVEKTGNAKSFDVAKTEIAIKDDKQPYLGLLVKDLEGKYTLATESSVLDSSSQYDVVITLGK